MGEGERGKMIAFPGEAIETAEVVDVGVESKIASAQIGYKGLFYFGDRFRFSGDRGRLCHVPAKYKNCEVLALNAEYAVVVDPVDQSKKAVLRIPSDLWAKDEGKSYYSFLEGEDIWNIEGENLEKYSDADWYGQLTDFGYVDKESRRSARSEKRDEQKKDEILEGLRRQGVIEEKNGLRIWDPEALRGLVISAALSGDERHLGVSGKNSRDMIFTLLKDEVGVLKEEFEESQRSSSKDQKKILPHQIFYLPSSLDETFSPAMIKSRNNRIGYWDIGSQGMGGGSDWNKIIELLSGEDVSINEMFLAKAIYGDLRGFRDDKGVLKVFDEQVQNFTPINGEALRRLTGRSLGDSSKTNYSLYSPVEYVTKKCPELTRRGLLTAQDFKGKIEWRRDVGRQITPISIGGSVSIGGHSFYVKNVIDMNRRNDFGGVQLSNDEYAIVEIKPDGRQEIVAVRKLVVEANRERKTDSFHQYKITRENYQLPDESNEDYAERIRRMVDYGFVAKMVSEIASETATLLKADLTWREQQWLASALYARPDLKRAVVEATKNFGTDFLRTFLSCEYDVNNAEKILSLIEKLKSEEAEKLFKKYGEIVQMVEDLESSLTEVTARELGSEKKREIRENILRRAKNLLVEFAEGKKNPAEGNILQRIESVQADAIVFGTTFKTLFKENPNIDIKEMRGLDLQRTPLTQLTDKDKTEMIEIAKRNWLSRAEGKDVVENFIKVLQSNRQIDFYVLHRDNKIISFLRFDEADADGKRHAASFNVDPKYGGSAIGEMMVRTVLVAETEKSTVEISVFPYQEKAPEYVEEIGFNITGILHGEKPGTEELVMTCEREKNNQFVSRSSKKEILMSLVVSDSARNWREMIGHNVIVLKFNPTKERTDLISAAEGLIKEGYVGTRHFVDPQNKSERYYAFEFDRSKVRAEEIAHDEIRQAANG